MEAFPFSDKTKRGQHMLFRRREIRPATGSARNPKQLKKIPPRSLSIMSHRRKIGISLAGAAAILLLISYVSGSLVLAYIGLSIGLWSVISVFAVKNNIMSAELFVSASFASANAIRNIVSSLGYKGRAVFLYPKSFEGIKRGYLYISKDGKEIPQEKDVSVTGPITWHEGILLEAPAGPIVELFEKRLGVNFIAVDVNYLRDALPKLLIQDLRIADSVAVEEKGKNVEITIGGSICSEICAKIYDTDGQSNHYICPICSASALIVSKVTRSPVSIESSIVSENQVKTTIARLTK